MDGAQQPGNTNDPANFKPADPNLPQVYGQPEVLMPRSVATPPTGPDGAITWTASEFIAHHKSVNWYIVLGLATVALAVLGWFLSQDVVSSVFVCVIGFTFGLVAARKPREIGYRLDSSGLSLGVKHYPYQIFRSFSVVPEGAFSSIVFMPLKRFSQITTIYYDPSDEGKIIDLLSQRLPLAPRSHDLIDRLMWRIRF